MPEIRILPDRVANQIAAGEVVERPVAVVKELVENSIDAGATKIEIEFRNGGKSYLRVEDDGCGMNPDQALLSLERHATSKVRKASDLHEVSTFGFRGEALPSISAVTGPAERVGLCRHVSTTFWKFSTISKTVRQIFVGQTVQKLQPIHVLSSLGLYLTPMTSILFPSK